MLMWGDELVPSITKNGRVTDDHIKMPDLFLDGIIYAYNYTIAKNSDEIKLLQRKLSKLIKSDVVAVETLR